MVCINDLAEGTNGTFTRVADDTIPRRIVNREDAKRLPGHGLNPTEQI